MGALAEAAVGRLRAERDETLRTLVGGVPAPLSPNQ